MVVVGPRNVPLTPRLAVKAEGSAIVSRPSPREVEIGEPAAVEPATLVQGVADREGLVRVLAGLAYPYGGSIELISRIVRSAPELRVVGQGHVHAQHRRRRPVSVPVVVVLLVPGPVVAVVEVPVIC